MCVTNTVRRHRPISLDASKVAEAPADKETLQRSQRSSVVRPPQFSAELFFGTASKASTASTYTNTQNALHTSFSPWSAAHTYTSAAQPSTEITRKPQRPKRKRKPQKPGKTAKMNDRHFVVHNYHDHACDSPDENDVEQEAAFSNASATTSASNAKRRGGVTVSFPLKLHAMLDQIEADGLAHVISWQPHGRAFVVHNPKEFVSHVMPKYFRQSKLTSFQRQLNLYGFCRLTKGNDNRGYYHELFLRGRPFLCKNMTRTKVKGTGFKAASSPDQEPDFYTMPPVIVTPPMSSASDEGSLDSEGTMTFDPYYARVQSDSSLPPAIDRCNSDAATFAMAPISPMSPVRSHFVISPQQMYQQQLQLPNLYSQQEETQTTTATTAAPPTDDDVFDSVVEELFVDHMEENDEETVDDFIQSWALQDTEDRKCFELQGIAELVDIDTNDEALKDDFQFGCLLESFLAD